jgi:hypothetical protein
MMLNAPKCGLMTAPTPKEPEAISEVRSGLAGGRYEGCGGYGCYSHTWHIEDVLLAYDAMKAERDAAVRERESAMDLAMADERRLMARIDEVRALKARLAAYEACEKS